MSADPVSLSADLAVSFDLYGISAGTTRLAFVYSRKDYTSYDKYVQGYKDITVYSADSEVWTPESIDITPSFTANLGSWPVIEGISVNNNKNPSSTVEVILSSEPNIPLEYYYDYVTADAKITLRIYSGDVEVKSYDKLPPIVTSEYDDYGTEYVTDLYYGAFPFSSDITRIEWTSSGGIII